MRIDDPNDPATPEPSAAEEALSALDTGLATLGGEGGEPAAPAAAAEPPQAEPAAPAAADPAAPAAPAEGEPSAEPPVPGTPEAAAADADKAKAAAEAAGKEADAAIAAEASALGLKGKANDRFIAMANEIKTLAPIKELLDKAGIKDPASELPKLVEKSKAADDIIGMVMDTGATSDQYGKTLDYLAMVNSGDPGKMNQAFDTLLGELKDLGKLIGREVAGAYDPLDDYADLKGEIEAGDLTRARALEIVAQRNAAKIAQARGAQVSEQTQQAEALQHGRQALNDVGRELAAADPDYARKQPFLVPMLRLITQTRPPGEWAEAAKQAYAQIPALPAAAPPARPAPSPMRPAGPTPSLAPTTDDPMLAMEMGIAAASGR